MELNIIHLIIIVFSCVLVQFVFKWTVGNKIASHEDMLNQSRKDYHMLRRFQHMSTGVALMFIWAFSGSLCCTYGLFIGTFGFFSVNLCRFVSPKFNETYINSFGFLLRPHELNNMPGALYFLIGMTFAACLYGRIEVYMAMLILSFGDPFASLCGIYFKSPKIMKDKTIAGTVGCGLVCSIIGMSFYYLNSDFSKIRDEIMPMEFALAIFVVAFLAEIGPSSRKIHFEDNTSIPIYAGLLFTGYFTYIHPLSEGIVN